MPLVVAQSTEARTALQASIVDSSDDMQSILARVRSGERVEHYETVRLRKDGRLIDISLTVSPIYDSAGKLIGASSIARDTTERTRADERLRGANQSIDARRRHHRQDSGRDHHQLESWGELVDGYSASEITGKAMSMLIQPDRPGEIEGILARIRNVDRVEHYETVRGSRESTSA